MSKNRIPFFVEISQCKGFNSLFCKKRMIINVNTYQRSLVSVNKWWSKQNLDGLAEVGLPPVESSNEGGRVRGRTSIDWK